jgi:membrane protein DedA with SNARE-associated domain
LLLGLAAVRAVVAVVAVPLAPALYRGGLVEVLVLLRPSKEVLLLAGYAIEQGDASLPAVVAAAAPLLLGAVWVMFGLGRAYADCIDDEHRTGLARRLLPPKKVRVLVDALCARGPVLVFLGRLAAFPSTLVGAAAGGAEVSTRRFLVADTLGAVTSLAALLTIGSLLEEAYEGAGPWLTGAGLLVLLAGAVVLGRTLKRSAGRTRRGRGAASRR